MKKQRTYQLFYWANDPMLRDVIMTFDNKNEAYKWMYRHDYKPFRVIFLGWKNN